MKKAVAFGLFIVALLIGSSFVIIGATSANEPAVWAGMIIIALGVLNLAVKVTAPSPRPHVRLKVVEPKKLRKKPVKRKKRPAKRKKKKK